MRSQGVKHRQSCKAAQGRRASPVAGVAVEWRDRRALERHFRLHGRRLRTRTIEGYDRSARETIETGTQFAYWDVATDDWRRGYYDRLTERFIAVTDDGTQIVTHFRCPERYVEQLPRSTYA
jgi:hypothetical protein